MGCKSNEGSAMSADRIEREIEIEAPVDVVWAVVTEPHHIASWFTDSATLDLRPGGEGRLDFTSRSTGGPATVNLRVERIDRPRFFSFRWTHPDGTEPDETNSLLVELRLEAAGEATRLHLVESGFERASRGQHRSRADHDSGWDVHLGRLQEYAAGSAVGG
jgi:uncharacterized protein YndB with AHSA1/START domain